MTIEATCRLEQMDFQDDEFGKIIEIGTRALTEEDIREIISTAQQAGIESVGTTYGNNPTCKEVARIAVMKTLESLTIRGEQ